MLRVLLSLVFILHLALGSEVAVEVEEDPCSQSCPGDSPDGQCPPNCSSCECCPQVRPVVLSDGATGQVPELRPVIPALELPVPAAPEPRDILHVPKSVLA